VRDEDGQVQLLVPCNPLEPREPDPQFVDDVAQATQAGWSLALLDHDELCAGAAKRAVRRVPEAGGPTVYRGWMVTARHYADLARVLSVRGSVLRTTPEAFQGAHELPSWYNALQQLTPESRWTDDADVDAFADLCHEMGGALVLRDFVKSEKHYWDQAAFIADGADRAGVLRTAARFLELRGEHLAGGLVARRFEHFEGPEIRTWWVDGHCVALTPHPDTPDHLPATADVPPTISTAVSAARTRVHHRRLGA
jgi:hypothetical protein